MDIPSIILPANLENMQLPDPSLLYYYSLKENRIFYVDTEIDEGILELQKAIILINKADISIPVNDRIPIKILIDSPGGLLSETMSLCSTIRMSKTPVYTVNVADAFSGGALLLMAGHKRFAFPYSTAMVHTGSGGTSGTFEQTIEQSKNYKKKIDMMSSYILEQTKMDEKVYKKNKAKEWYMDANEQIQYGLVHEIIGSLDEIL